MATSKIITLTDLSMGRMYLNPPQSGSILVQRDYRFMSGSTIFNALGTQVMQREIAVSAVPASVINALQAIDNWTYQQALLDQGMQ